MGSKNKGTRAERELLHMFYDTKIWACFRAAGSGSIPIPCPDLIAGNSSRILAIECKALKEKTKYFDKQEIKDLEEFANKFGAEPWLAVRFDNVGWFFVKSDQLDKTNKNPSISLEKAKKEGLSFENLIK